jgi:hypothetical protein
MNPRIRELLDAASYSVLGVRQIDQNQFAELIIQECADLFKLTHSDEQCPRRIDTTILRHFEQD